MNTTDAWEGIGKPSKAGSYSSRRADPSHPLNFWRARDVENRFVFYQDINTLPDEPPKTPVFAGINITFVKLDNASCRLVLTLVDSEQYDLFRCLCTDLLEATRGVTPGDDIAGMHLVFSRLRRWQELLRNLRTGILKRSAIMGLVGELLFLRDFVLNEMTKAEAVRSWRGPFGDEQDFLLQGRIIEVKSQLSTSDKYLSINSAEQLEVVSSPIMIAHQTLDSPSGRESGGLSLNELVAEISEILERSDFVAADLFQAALVSVRYTPREDYDAELWLLNNRMFFEVRDGFPALVPSLLPNGVERVRYRIAVDACQEFLIDENNARDWAFNDNGIQNN